jgi:hypothetical protein
MNNKRLMQWTSALVLCASAGLAGAQEAKKEIEPVVPVGPPVVPVATVPVGPAVQPVVPLEALQGVDTVTLQTPRGPVVVVSWPTSNPPLKPDNNVDFGRVDANRDNHLTLDELKSATPGSAAAGRLATRFDAMDANNDDKLSTDEVMGWVHR